MIARKWMPLFFKLDVVFQGYPPVVISLALQPKMSNLPVHLPPPQRLTPLPAVSLPEAFLCGGLAGCAAVTVCKNVPLPPRSGIVSAHTGGLCLSAANIPEVMKTRLQLQGELIKTSDAPKVYKNVFDVFRKTWANEGLRGLQRGLGPAVSSATGDQRRGSRRW